MHGRDKPLLPTESPFAAAAATASGAFGNVSSTSSSYVRRPDIKRALSAKAVLAPFAQVISQVALSCNHINNVSSYACHTVHMI